MHCSYLVLGAWCCSHACLSGSFKAPHLNPSHVSSLASVRVAGMHCLDAACTLFEGCLRAACMHLCAAGALLCFALRCLCTALRCLAHTCALPCVTLRSLAHASSLLMSNRKQHACRGAHASFPTASICPIVP